MNHLVKHRRGQARPMGPEGFLSFRAAIGQMRCHFFFPKEKLTGHLTGQLTGSLKGALTGRDRPPYPPTSKYTTYLQKRYITVIYENIGSSPAIPSKSPPFQETFGS